MKWFWVIFIVSLLLVSAFPMNYNSYPHVNYFKENRQVKNFYSYPPVWVNSTFYINENTKDPLTGKYGYYGVDTPVIIGPTGKIVVQNAHLYFLSSIYNIIYFIIQGQLIVNNGSVTVAPNMLGPSLYLNMTVSTTGAVYLYNSSLSFFGNLNIYGGSFYAYDSKITGVNQTSIQKAIQFGMNKTGAEMAKYAPSINISYSNNVKLINSVISPMFKSYPSNESLLAVGYSPYLKSVPNPGLNLISENYTLLNPVQYYYLIENITVNIYYRTGNNFVPGTSKGIVELTTPDGSYTLYSMTKPINGSSPVLTFQINLTKLPIQNRTAFVSPPMFIGYYLNGVIRVFIDQARANEIIVSSVFVNFNTPLNVSRYMQYHIIVVKSSTFYILNSYIDLNYNLNASYYDALYAYSYSTIYWYNTSINTTSSGINIPIFEDSSTNIYIFRNAIVYARNWDGTYVVGSSVNILPYDIGISQSYVNNLNRIIWNIYNPSFVTNSSGIVILPLLSDVLNYNYFPNGLYLGNYNLTFYNPINGGKLKEVTISLNHFPMLSTLSNNYPYVISFNIPDFRVISVNVPKPLIIGKTYTLSAYVGYFGGPPTENTTVIFKLQGPKGIQNFGTFPVLLQRNASVTRTNSISLSGLGYGNYTIIVEINSYHTIFETNYFNDIFSEKITIYPNVDFAIENVNLSESYLLVPVKISFKTQNLGTDSFFTANLEVYYIYNTKEYIILNKTIPSAPENFSVSFIPSFPGIYTLYIIINQIWDYNQSNNIYEQTLTFNVDYFVSKITYNILSNPISPSTTSVQVSLNVYIGSKNVLPIDIPPLLVNYYLNNIYIGSSYVRGFQNYAVSSLTYTLRVGSIYNLRVWINANKAYNESDYSNDNASFTIQIPIVNGYSILPGSAQYNSTLNVYGTFNITTGSLSNTVILLKIGPKQWNYYIGNFTGYSSFNFRFNISLVLLHITTPTVFEKYSVLVTGDQLNGSSVIIGSGNIFIYYPASINVTYFGIYQKANYTLGMFVPFKIVLKNIGGIASTPMYANITLGNYSKEFLVPSIPAQKTYIMIVDFNLTQVGPLTSYLQLGTLNITGPIINVGYPYIQPYVIMSSHNVLGGNYLEVQAYLLNLNATQEYGYSIYEPNYPVYLYLAGRSYMEYTSSNGSAVFLIQIPTNISGNYTVRLSFNSGGQLTYQDVGYVIISQPFPILTVSAILIIIIIFVSLYFVTTIQAKHEFMRKRTCPNCGAPIYEKAIKCPVCDYNLEEETDHCYVCDTLYPKHSKYCPNCGEIFTDERDLDYAFLSTVKDEYDKKLEEIHLNYLQMRKPESEFFIWWMNNKNYESFRLYLLKEEFQQKKKECLSCGAINDIDADICKVCSKPLPPSYTIPPPILDGFRKGILDWGTGMEIYSSVSKPGAEYTVQSLPPLVRIGIKFSKLGQLFKKNMRRKL
jgi:ribosomal protein S27AE